MIVCGSNFNIFTIVKLISMLFDIWLLSILILSINLGITCLTNISMILSSFFILSPTSISPPPAPPPLLLLLVLISFFFFSSSLFFPSTSSSFFSLAASSFPSSSSSTKFSNSLSFSSSPPSPSPSPSFLSVSFSSSSFSSSDAGSSCSSSSSSCKGALRAGRALISMASSVLVGLNNWFSGSLVDNWRKWKQSRILQDSLMIFFWWLGLCWSLCLLLLFLLLLVECNWFNREERVR